MQSGPFDPWVSLSGSLIGPTPNQWIRLLGLVFPLLWIDDVARGESCWPIGHGKADRPHVGLIWLLFLWFLPTLTNSTKLVERIRNKHSNYVRSDMNLKR